MRLPLRPSLACVGAVTLVGACLAVPEGEGVPKPITDRDDAGGSAIYVDGSAGGSSWDALSELPPSDPHQLIGIDPPHGPFTGGNRALVRGQGFSSALRVWFGSFEVPAEQVLAVDPTRVQVTVPPSSQAGPVDVRVQNGTDQSTSRTLLAAYEYDGFYAQPSTGPTAGGTVITLHGLDTAWTQDVTVAVGGLPCSDIQVDSPTELRCTTPAHPTATVSIRVQLPGQSAQLVEDLFTYADSDNGYKGGLSGEPLAGTLQVIALNAYTGDPIGKVKVIAGDSLSSALQAETNSSGIAVFQDPSLGPKRSVTLAKDCYQPVTFIDVPVDTVTAYLSPIMSPECGADGGDIPPVGGRGTAGGWVDGQLVWQGGIEFQRAPWGNIPIPKGPNEQQVAYVFSPATDPGYRFWLPDASMAIRPDSPGDIGYKFMAGVYPGNVTLYALAGIEDRTVSPAQFTAYAFGLVNGVAVQPDQTATSVYISMDHPLEQALVLSATPPTPGPRGPDRLISSVAVQLSAGSYALFPNAWRSTPLSTTGDITFVGLPGLDGSLAGAQYVSSARAVTGPNDGAPRSVVGRYLSADPSIAVPMGDFVQVPVLQSPAPTDRFDGQHLTLGFASGGAPIDVTVLHISAGQGLVEWLVVAPGARTSIELPDLRALGLGLPQGPVLFGVYAGHIDDRGGFNYGTLVYRQTDERGWMSYAYDVFNSYY